MLDPSSEEEEAAPAAAAPVEAAVAATATVEPEAAEKRGEWRRRERLLPMGMTRVWRRIEGEHEFLATHTQPTDGRCRPAGARTIAHLIDRRRA
eukprot:6624566-Prymnesium_polylepis.1